MFCKQVFLEILQNAQENNCARASFLACNFIKKDTLTQVFSCEFYEFFQNTFFHRTPLVAASKKCYYSFQIAKLANSNNDEMFE